MEIAELVPFIPPPESPTKIPVDRNPSIGLSRRTNWFSELLFQPKLVEVLESCVLEVAAFLVPAVNRRCVFWWPGLTVLANIWPLGSTPRPWPTSGLALVSFRHCTSMI
jgi:hypothetical protein